MGQAGESQTINFFTLIFWGIFIFRDFSFDFFSGTGGVSNSVRIRSKLGHSRGYVDEEMC